MAVHAIDIRSVDKLYGSVKAVRSLDLSVDEGQFVALLGPSGCGKTTTLRMIAGLEHPSSGDIYIKGTRINDVPVHRRNFGVVFQSLALFPHKNVFQNVAFGLQYRKTPKSEIIRRVRRALEVVRLPGMEERLPAQLSGGQQQRVAVARAIVFEPELLLFDEPLSALDASLREEMRFELKRIQKALGITAVFVTHDQAEALSMADKVVVMRDGLKEQEGTPMEIYGRPQTEFVASFFGRTNRLAGRVISSSGEDLRIRTLNGIEFTRSATTLDTATDVQLLLRAERVRAILPGRDDVRKSLQGKVIETEFLGLMVRYVIKTGESELNVVQPVDGHVFAQGDDVDLVVPVDSFMVVSNGKVQ